MTNLVIMNIRVAARMLRIPRMAKPPVVSPLR